MFVPQNKITSSRIFLIKIEKSFNMAQKHYTEVHRSLPELSPWLEWATPQYKIEDSYEYILKCHQEWDKGQDYTYAINNHLDNFMGTISVFNIKEKDKSIEFGYWISTQYAGNGYMQEAVSLLEKEFFNMGINRIVIHTDVLNLKSANVAVKRGFTLEGIQRQKTWFEAEQRYRDINTFSKLKKEYQEI